MLVIQQHYHLKPCKIVLQRIKEDRPTKEKSLAVNGESFKNVRKEQWHVKNDKHNPCKIRFKKIKDVKQEIKKENECDDFSHEVTAPAPNDVLIADGNIPALYLKEIKEEVEDVMEEDEIPINEAFLNFIGCYEENEMYTSDPLATEAESPPEWQQTPFQADNSSHPSALQKEPSAESDAMAMKKYLFFCSHCPFWSADEELMKLHNLKEHAENLASDPLFPSATQDLSTPAEPTEPSEPTTGMCDQANENIYSCSVCATKCSTKEGLEVHVCSYTHEKPFPNSDCSGRFYRKKKLKKLIQNNLKKLVRRRIYSCSVCPARFYHISGLAFHSVIHKIKTCPSVSTGKKYVDRKVSRLREEVNHKPVPCLISNNKSTHEHGVERPRKNAPLLCPGKRTRKRRVGQSRKTASREVYYCSVCPAKFSVESHSITHMHKHCGRKPEHFQCSVCSAKFSLRRHLASHMLSHSGEKPLACSVHPAKFSLESYLATQTLTHSRGKPFVCPKCPDHFSTKLNLKKHLLFIHPRS